MINRTILLAFLICSINNLNAQTFTVKEVGTSYTDSQISNAMENGDWCGFYYMNSKRVLNFDDGSIVELSSGQDLLLSDSNFDQSCFSAEDGIDDKMYSVHSSGRIAMKVNKSSSLKTHIRKD